MRRPSAILAALLLLASACSAEATAPSPTARPSATGVSSLGVARIQTANGTVTLSVEIAEDEATRERGLMGRTSLSPDSGMVFLFPDTRARTFWMKDTLIPLAIAFFAEGGGIVSIREMTPCHADPCTLYSSGAPASGAVEANAGWFGDHGVTVGDRIEVLRE